jgi:dihydroneopterin aldolase
MDIIYINELRVQAIIGVFAWERQLKQTLVIDLELGTDIRAAAASDALTHTLDYRAIARRSVQFIEASRFQLVEALAERLAELLRSEFSIPWLRLTVHKPGAVRGARDVGVTIERGARA